MKIFLVEISKEEGKKLMTICPQYVQTTVHRRHYYMVENPKAFKLLNKIKEG